MKNNLTYLKEAMQKTNLDWVEWFDCNKVAESSLDFKPTPQQALELIHILSSIYPSEFLDIELKPANRLFNIETYINALKPNSNFDNFPNELLQTIYLNPVISLEFLSEYLNRLSVVLNEIFRLKHTKAAEPNSNIV